LTLRLFKIACLAYKPSQVHYRDVAFDRTSIIQMRRDLIDRIQVLVGQYELFKKNAYLPRRYFDDLMVSSNYS
jgi:hypothetical protein